MNILYVEPATNFSGGVNQTILNSIELKKRGHKVFLACVENSPIHKKLKNEGFEFVFIDEERAFYSAKIIKSFLSENSIDIVHTHHSKGHKIGLLALLTRRKEKLVVQRSVIFPATNVFKYLNPRVNLFIANSQAVKKVLIKYFVNPKKIRVVYSAVQPERFNDVVKKEEIKKKIGLEDKFVFGVVGNYSDYKGHDIALEAFARVQNKEGAALVFVGKDTEKLSKKAKELGVDKDIVILGFKSDAYDIIKGFDCLVIPSLQESFPNVAIEAFFVKTPVLGTNVGGIPELLEETRGFLCKPNSESMSNAMIMVYNFSSLDKVAEKAYEFALENLTIEKKVDALEDIYEGLLKK